VTVQDLTTIIGAVGGLGGLGALVASFLQRKKVRAEAADVITDTALTLVEPLQRRVRELDGEVTELRRKVRTITDGLTDAVSLIRRWRASMLSTAISREELREMAREQLDAERTPAPH
jgi:hypothetical protein